MVLLATVAAAAACARAIDDRRQLSVFTYNRYMFSAAGSISDVLRAVDADIVGLQENGQEWGVSEAFALGYYYRQFSESGANVYCGSTAILSRYPIVESPELTDGVQIDLGAGHRAYVFNVHLPPGPYQPYRIQSGEITTAQQAQSEAQATRGTAIASVLAQMASPLASGSPVFLVGDFNEPSHLDWTAAASAQNQNFGAVAWPTSTAIVAAGLHDAFRTFRPSETAFPGLTWTSKPAEPDEPMDRIDMVYYGGENITLASAETVGESNTSADVVVNPWPSDHRGVLATFTTTLPATPPSFVNPFLNPDAAVCQAHTTLSPGAIVGISVASVALVAGIGYWKRGSAAPKTQGV